jgi:hypothetical protein
VRKECYRFFAVLVFKLDEPVGHRLLKATVAGSSRGDVIFTVILPATDVDWRIANPRP